MESKQKDSEAFAYEGAESIPKKPKFPDVRYFQIHFEFMEAQLHETHLKLEKMQQQLVDMQNQLPPKAPKLSSVRNDNQNKLGK